MNPTVRRSCAPARWGIGPIGVPARATATVRTGKGPGEGDGGIQGIQGIQGEGSPRCLHGSMADDEP